MAMGQINCQQQEGAEEECPLSAQFLFPFRPQAVSSLCQKDGAADSREQKVEHADASVPHRSVCKAEIAVIEGEKSRAGGGRRGTRQRTEGIIFPPHPQETADFDAMLHG